MYLYAGLHCTAHCTAHSSLHRSLLVVLHQNAILNTDFALFLNHVHDRAALKAAVQAAMDRARQVTASFAILGDAVLAAWPSWDVPPTATAAQVLGPLIRWLPNVMTSLKEGPTPTAAVYDGRGSSKGAWQSVHCAWLLLHGGWAVIPISMDGCHCFPFYSVLMP